MSNIIFVVMAVIVALVLHWAFAVPVWMLIVGLVAGLAGVLVCVEMLMRRRASKPRPRVSTFE